MTEETLEALLAKVPSKMNVALYREQDDLWSCAIVKPRDYWLDGVSDGSDGGERGTTPAEAIRAALSNSKDG